MKKVVDGCNKMEFSSLNELFEAWKNAQINEIEWENTFPKKYENGQPIIPPEEFKGSFCVDGFLSDKFNGVLFILKESNTCSDEPKGEYEDTFWFKENTEKEISGEKIDDSYWNRYHRNMEWYLRNAFGGDINYYECAYMNLNKRGGYGKCDDMQLSNYINSYGDLIEEQIRIINPKCIFCCGQGKISVYELVRSITKECVPDAKIYNCRHLSCWAGNKFYD